MIKANCYYDFYAQKVIDGTSKIFNDWKKHVPSLDKDKFLTELKWLYSDPRNKDGCMTRELGLMNKGLVRLKRVYNRSEFCGFVTLDGKLWSGDFFDQELNEKYRKLYGEEKIKVNLQISISPEDRI